MNHQWAMRMGEESLKLELLRRQAKTDLERSKVAAPSLATPSKLGQWLIYLISLPVIPKSRRATYLMKQS